MGAKKHPHFLKRRGGFVLQSVGCLRQIEWKPGNQNISFFKVSRDRKNTVRIKRKVFSVSGIDFALIIKAVKWETKLRRRFKAGGKESFSNLRLGFNFFISRGRRFGGGRDIGRLVSRIIGQINRPDINDLISGRTVNNSFAGGHIN